MPAMTDQPSGNVLLRNARLVLPERVIEHGSLLVSAGRVASFSEQETTTTGVKQEIDLKNATVYPGFIDVHIHGAAGVDTLAAEPEDLDRVSQFLATKGVTGWLPTLVPASTADYVRSIAAITKSVREQGLTGGAGMPIGARMLGVHYEGPFVNSTQCGALRPQFLRSYSGAHDVAELPVLDEQLGKHLITVAPEIEGGIELVLELHRRGWIVSIGHTRADFAQLDQAFSAGAHHMTHFMNAMAPLHHRAPGPVAWGLLRDDVTCDVIADGVHLDPQMLQLLLKSKSADRLMLISDAIAAAGVGDGDYRIWGETITVKDGRTNNASGNIAGSVITMLDAVRVMRSLGVSEVDLARMAATNPARLLGIDHDCGSIEEGKRADLVALDAQGNAVLTIIGGAIAFQKSDE